LKAWLRRSAPDIVGGRFVRAASPTDATDVIEIAASRGRLDLVVSIDAETPVAFVAEKGRMADALPQAFSDPPESTFSRVLNFQVRGAVLEEIRQAGFDRQMDFVWAMTSRFGVTSRRLLHFEPMGRASNLYLLTDRKTVVALRRRVPPGKTSFRQVVIGRPYPPPPPLRKITTNEIGEDAFVAALGGYAGTVADLLRRTFAGFDKELTQAFLTDVGLEGRASRDVTRSEARNVRLEMARLYAEPERAVALLAGGADAGVSEFLLARFVERERGRRERTESPQPGPVPSRLALKIAALERELARCEGAPGLEEAASAVYEAMADVSDDDSRRAFLADLVLEHPAAEGVVRADESLGKNAQALYAEAARLRRGKVEIEERLRGMRTTAERPAGTLDADARPTRPEAQAPRAADARDRLFTKLRRQGAKFKVYISSDGIPIICSENEASNHALYKRLGQTDYVFFHARDYPGAYVILCASEEEPPRASVVEAAATAAAHSKAGKAAEIDVTYTKMKNLYRFKGAKPGQVMLRHEKVMLADAAKFRDLEERQTALRTRSESSADSGDDAD